MDLLNLLTWDVLHFIGTVVHIVLTWLIFYLLGNVNNVIMQFDVRQNKQFEEFKQHFEPLSAVMPVEKSTKQLTSTKQHQGTRFGCRSQPVIYNGIRYDSIAKAAKHNGVSVHHINAYGKRVS